MGHLRNFLMFLGTEKLRDIFHYKHFCACVFDNFKVGPPELLSGIAVPVFVEKAKPLAWWAADDDIRLWNFINSMFCDFQNVFRSAMVAEIGVVGLGGIGIMVIGPNGFKNLSECLCEAQRQAARARKKVNDPIRPGGLPQETFLASSINCFVIGQRVVSQGRLFFLHL